MKEYDDLLDETTKRDTEYQRLLQENDNRLFELSQQNSNLTNEITIFKDQQKITDDVIEKLKQGYLSLESQNNDLSKTIETLQSQETNETIPDEKRIDFSTIKTLISDGSAESELLNKQLIEFLNLGQTSQENHSEALHKLEQEYNQKCAELETSQNESVNKLKDLEEKIKQISHEKEELLNNFNQLSSSNHSNVQNHKELIEQLQSANNIIAEKEQKNKDLENQILALQNISEENNELRKKFEAISELNDLNLSKIDELTHQNKSKDDSIESKEKEMNNEITLLKLEIEQLKESNLNTQSNYDEIIQTLKDFNANFGVKEEIGENDIEFTQNLIQNLGEIVNHANYFNIFKKLESSCTQIVQNENFKKSAHIEIDNENMKEGESIFKLISGAQNLLKLHEENEVQFSNLKTEYETKLSEMESKSDNLEETNKKINILQATNNDLTNKLNEMTKLQEKTASSFLSLDEENKRLSGICESLKSSAKELAEEADKSVKKQLAEKLEIAQKLSTSVIDNTKYKNELTKLFKANEELEKDNEELKQHCKNSTEMVAKLKERLNTSIKDIESKHSENILELNRKINDEFKVKLEKAESDLQQAQALINQNIEKEKIAEQQKKDLIEEINKIKAEMDEFITNNKESITKLEIELAQSQEQLSQTKEELSKSKEENKKLQIDKDQLITGSQSQEDSQVKRIQELIEKTNQFESQLTQKTNEIDKLKTLLNSNMEKLYKETQDHKKNSAHKEEEINQLNGKTKDLEQQLSQLTNLHQAKELECINVQQKHQETVDKLNNEILELKNSFAEIKKLLETSTEENAKLNIIIQEKELEIKKFEQDSADLIKSKDVVNEMSIKLQNLEQEKLKQETEINSLNENIQVKDKEINSLKEQISSSTNENKELLTSNQSLTTKCTNFETEAIELKDQLHTVSESALNKDKLINEKEDKIKRLSEETLNLLNEKDSEISNLNGQIDKLKELIVQVKEESSTETQSVLNEKCEEIDALKHSNMALNDTIAKLTLDLTEIANKLDQVHNTHSEEKRQSSENFSNLQKEFNSTVEALKKSEGNLKEQKERLDEIEKEHQIALAAKQKEIEDIVTSKDQELASKINQNIKEFQTTFDNKDKELSIKILEKETEFKNKIEEIQNQTTDQLKIKEQEFELKLNQKVQELEGRLLEKDKECETNLSLVNQDFTGKLNAKDQELLKKLEIKDQELENYKRMIEQKVEQNKLIVDENNTEREQQQSKITELESNIQTIQAEVKKERELIKQTHSHEIKQKDAEIVKLSAENKEIQNEKESLSKHVTEIAKRLAEYEVSMTNQEKVVKEKDLKHTELESVKSSLEKCIEDLNSKLNLAEKDLELKQKRIKDLEISTDSTDKKLKSISEEKEEIKKQFEVKIQEILDKNLKLEKDITNAEKDRERFRKELESKKVEGSIKAKQDELEKSQIRVRTLEEKLEIVETKLSNANRKIDDEKVSLLRSMSILKEEIKEKDSEIKKLVEKAKDSEEKCEEYIEKCLIRGVLVKYFSHKAKDDISKSTLKAIAAMLNFSLDEKLNCGISSDDKHTGGWSFFG